MWVCLTADPIECPAAGPFIPTAILDIESRLAIIIWVFKVFRGKKVLITGHTGFKGSWLAAWLGELDAEVAGIALAPPTEPSHFKAADLGTELSDHRIDIRNKEALGNAIAAEKPDFLFHLAAQPLVRSAYADPVLTYETNVLGTLHVLEALRSLTNPCVAVLITSDKAYDNVEWAWGYRECDALGGSDPYSASKGAAELVIRSHVRSFFPLASSGVRIGVARAGNVIGGGDWAADRIVPDCVRAWSRGETVTLRNSQATRPWQHVLEPLSGYLALAAHLLRRPELHGEPFNFGPASAKSHTVGDLVREMALHWKRVQWREEAATASGPHESGLLRLNCDKALHHLEWRPVMTFEETVRLTADWYRSYYDNSGTIREVTREQVRDYCSRATLQGLPWAR